MSYEEIETLTRFDDIHERPVKQRSKGRYAITGGMTAFLILGIIVTAATVKMSRGTNWINQESSTVITAPNEDPSEPDPKSKPESLYKSYLDASLEAFNPQVLRGYDTCEEMAGDLTMALKSLAISEIQRQKESDPNWCNIVMYSSNVAMDAMAATALDTTAATKAAAPQSVGAAPEVAAARESSYGTNNQVKGVDEADMVKSDGTYIFSGYGNEVVVTDLHGKIVIRVTVPDVIPTSTTEPPTTETSTVDSMRVINPYPLPRQVQSLLLHSNKLTVIAHVDTWKCDYAICGGNTTAFIYEFDPNSSTLTLLSQIDVTGSFNGARSIGSNAHIFTNAYVDTWSFTQNFNRCSESYKNMTPEEYEEAAVQVANRTVIEYARKMMKGLPWTQSTDVTPSCQNIIRISTMSNQNLTAISEQRRLGGIWFYDQGLLQNFVQLTSFDVDQGSLAGIKANSAGAFSAGYSPQIFATEDRLVLASQGYRYEPTSGNEASYNEYTYLLTFDLSGALATPKSIGEVDGYFNDQYSIDFYNGFYRIATTIRQKWGSSYNETNNSYNWESISESTSQVYVLEEQSSELVTVGSVKDLGNGEVIQSVRFLGDKGYVVTFKRTDPLFIIDLSSPTEPSVSSELKVTGFSQYMYPIKDDNFLLTVGQEATEDGAVTGVKISVFNVTDPTSPFEVQKYVVENGNGWASSDASWDYHAFRYLDQSEILIIPERIYNWENPSASFDGFVVYKIDLIDGIMPLGNVTHADYNYMQYYCWGSAYLPSRSMVFDGDLVTFKSHSILRTSSVHTLKLKVWELNLDQGRNKSNESCYGYGSWVF